MSSLARGLALTLLTLAASTAAAQDRRSVDDRGWYAAAGAGVSRLRPDPGTTLQLEDDMSTAFGAWIGRDLSSRFSAEASVARLGEATLSGDSTIGYDAASIGLLGYLLGNSQGIAHRESLALYARGGLSFMRNESDLNLVSADDTAVWAAVGVDWPFARRVGLRAEVASYDGDAQAAFITLIARPRAARAGSRIVRGPSERPIEQPIEQPPVVATLPTPEPAPIAEVETTPAPAPAPAPAPVEPPAQDIAVLRTPQAVPPARPMRPNGIALPSVCPPARDDEPVTEAGCARFAGVLRGVEFVGGSARLTPIGARMLDRLVPQLSAYPDAIVEIQAHVSAGSSEQQAKRLSRERAVAVARHLATAGVSVSRLRARAFGDTRPRADNRTAGGRRLNDRIEIDVVR